MEAVYSVPSAKHLRGAAAVGYCGDALYHSVIYGQYGAYRVIYTPYHPRVGQSEAAAALRAQQKTRALEQSLSPVPSPIRRPETPAPSPVPEDQNNKGKLFGLLTGTIKNPYTDLFSKQQQQQQVQSLKQQVQGEAREKCTWTQCQVKCAGTKRSSRGLDVPLDLSIKKAKKL